ncbi:isochorismatase family protein [Nocardia sp. NPDC004860]|uniref:isochorismatase family protein n=1 Tax=Nocardia sp. NPDC004860 TaxID=3154557 RepID=UPI0033B1CEE4
MPTEPELPANLVDWAIEPHRAVLLVHDMQHYFLQPFADGCEPRSALMRNVRRLREHCEQLDIPTIYTAQPGSMTREQRGLLLDFWGPGMSARPEDRGIPSEIAPALGDPVLTKWRASAFHSTNLLERMHYLERDQLLICGVYAHVGVLLTAADAFANNVQAFVIADAVADFTPEYHRMAMEYVATRCGRVVLTSQVATELAAYETRVP